MKHLSAELLVDLAEGNAPESSQPHLATCAVCRAQLTELRDTLASIAFEVPEPSPLFWDHLSARVRESIAAEAAGSSSPGRFARLSWRLTAAMSAAVVILAVALTIRLSPSRTAVPPEVTPPIVASNEVSASIADDPSLSLLGDLAGGLDWDSVVEAGMTVPVGAADGAVTELNDVERVELQRLLRDAMSGSGA